MDSDKVKLPVGRKPAIGKGDDFGEFTNLKKITIKPKKLVTTRAIVVNIEPGSVIRKGYHWECTHCGEKGFSKTFKKSCRCRGGDIENTPEDITGYMCDGYDPKDAGTNPQFTPLFFANNLIPTKDQERAKFEIDLQTHPLIIKGEIQVLNVTKNIVNWFIKVMEFEQENINTEIDYTLVKKYNTIPKNDDFFRNYFVPSTYEQTLIKKIHALTLLAWYKVQLPNGVIEHATTSVMEAGDPGQNKTKEAMALMEYCENTMAKFVSVENSTMRGIIASAQKGPTGRWTIKVGKIPLAHKTLVVLDGFGALEQRDLAQIRSIQEEKRFQVVKAGELEKECAVRMICLSNLTMPVENFPNKHTASFNIAATTEERGNKFAGADRRRYEHIVVCGDTDTIASEIDQHFLREVNPTLNDEIKAFWNNLKTLAWNIKPEAINWGGKVVSDSMKILKEFREDYSDFLLDYSILSKAGLKRFLIQLPAVAVLHGAITEDKKVEIKGEHVAWLKGLYEEEFEELGLQDEKRRKQYLKTNAQEIVKGTSREIKEILALIFRYGHQTDIEKQGKLSRMTIWRKLSEPLICYSLEDEAGDIKAYNYNLKLGSGSIKTIGSGVYEKELFDVPDGVLEGINKKDGSLTEIGREICKPAYFEILHTTKKVKPTKTNGKEEEVKDEE